MKSRLGPNQAEVALVKVASRLRFCVQRQEAPGLYGGEKFLAMQSGPSIDTAVAVGERMRQAIALQPKTSGDTVLNLTISVGVASTDLLPAAIIEELISRAAI